MTQLQKRQARDLYPQCIYVAQKWRNKHRAFLCSTAKSGLKLVFFLVAIFSCNSFVAILNFLIAILTNKSVCLCLLVFFSPKKFQKVPFETSFKSAMFLGGGDHCSGGLASHSSQQAAPLLFGRQSQGLDIKLWKRVFRAAGSIWPVGKWNERLGRW